MNEGNLSATIDTLARRKADDFIAHVHSVVQNALKDAWHAKVAGGNAFLGDDIKAVLMAYAECIGHSDSYKKPKPTEELVAHCRATIVNDLLNGLPKLKELAMMQADEADQS